MDIYYSEKFAKEYKKLPIRIKRLAEKREEIFKVNPFDQRLKTHKLTGRLSNYWSFSIDFKYRIVFQFITGDDVWFLNVGGHEVYK